MNQQFKLGDKVVDPITGVTGTVTARCEYLYSSPSIRIEGKDGTGRATCDWIDESRAHPVTE